MEIIDENMIYLEEKRDSFKPEDTDFEELQAVKHSMFEISEACIDIASHIIAAEGFERPNEYQEVFTVLKKQDIINGDLEGKLKAMARFRNFITHRYDKIDDHRLKEILENDLEDIHEFNNAVYRYMDENSA